MQYLRKSKTDKDGNKIVRIAVTNANENGSTSDAHRLLLRICCITVILLTGSYG